MTESRTVKPNATQTLMMWALLAKGGESYAKDLKPEVKRPDRTSLVSVGLIASAKGARGAFRLEVTDKGWAWAADHLSAELPTGSKAGAVILQEWLTRLARYMRAKDVSLAEILATAESDARHDDKTSPDPTLRDRIRKAHLDITGGQLNRRALLSDIRAKLKDVDRAALDSALKQMHRDKVGMLMSLDNPREITDAVREAKLTFSGEPMHILWIKA
jgi:hypothetical protein